ncbi:DUF452 family protein [bacterium]|nr:DUF452 family protein [bacterium]
MKQYFINKNSNKLILFFAGWGCDEYEFEHLIADCDLLIFYDYTDLEYNFDFSRYSEINILSFSAGVFVGSVFKYVFNINKKIAVGGNPYLFDEKLGLSESMQKTLFELTEDSCEEFTKNYLVKTEEEYLNFHNAKRTPESCQKEFTALKNLYDKEYKNINDDYDIAIIGAEDPIFNPDSQKEYYSERIRIIDNARHNLFFRIKNYNEIFNLCIK